MQSEALEEHMCNLNKLFSILKILVTKRDRQLNKQEHFTQSGYWRSGRCVCAYRVCITAFTRVLICPASKKFHFFLNSSALVSFSLLREGISKKLGVIASIDGSIFSGGIFEKEHIFDFRHHLHKNLNELRSSSSYLLYDILKRSFWILDTNLSLLTSESLWYIYIWYKRK